MKCQPEHIQKPVQVITYHHRRHSRRTDWLVALPTARPPVRLHEELNFTCSDFLSCFLAYIRAVRTRPVKQVMFFFICDKIGSFIHTKECVYIV